MKPFSTFGSFLFGLIAIAHLARVIFGWTVYRECCGDPHVAQRGDILRTRAAVGNHVGRG